MSNTPSLIPPKIQRFRENNDTKGLIAALRNKKSPEIRSTAALVLGELRVTEAVDSLVDVLDDASASVRQAAAAALGQIEDQRAIEGLIPLLADSNGSVQLAAGRALSEIYHAGVLRLRYIISALTAIVKDPTTNEQRQSAMETLYQIGDPSTLDLVVDVLRKPNMHLAERTAAVRFLARFDDQRVEEALSAITKDATEDLALRLVCYSTLTATRRGLPEDVSAGRQRLAEAVALQIENYHAQTETVVETKNVLVKAGYWSTEIPEGMPSRLAYGVDWDVWHEPEYEEVTETTERHSPQTWLIGSLVELLSSDLKPLVRDRLNESLKWYV